MAGAPSDMVGLLELWNKKAEWRIRREEGQFGQCPKEKVFFFSDVLPINYYDYKSTYGSTNSSVWTQETHCSEFKL